MPREYSPLRKTVYDLYVERDRLPWYFRATALIASWLVLAGYILFALIFTSNAGNLKTSRTALTSIGAAFFILGNISIAATAAFSKSILFLFDAVLLPILTSSVLGLAVIVFNYALQKKLPVSDIYIIVPLVVASTSTVISAVLAGWIYHRTGVIRKSDNRRKVVKIPRDNQYAWPGMGDTGSTAELLPSAPPMVIPEDEQQRQQLLRLLLKREGQRAHSPDGASSTYRIDLPAPLNGSDYFPVANANSMNQFDESSLPGSATRFQLSKLLGGRNFNPTADSFKDPRERRREQIEKGGSPGDISAHMSINQWAGLGVPMPYTPGMPGTPPAWNGPATRYA